MNWVIEEATKQNIHMQLILREDIQIGIINDNLTCHINGNSPNFPDLAIVRTVEPLLNLQLETMGIHVFNSSDVSRICNNKALTHFMIQALEVPMVDTLFINKDNLITQPPMDYPFVVKDVESRGGKHVYLIKDQVEWDRLLNQLSFDKLIIQSCNVQMGKDLRVFIVGKRIIGAVLRESSTNFKANFKLGGSAVWYNLSSNEEQMISKIISHFDFGMVGIDFLIDYDGNLLFNEIEDVVGSRILSQVSDKNIVREYITYIKKRLTGD